MHRPTRGTLFGLALLFCAALFIAHQLMAQQSPHGPLSIPCTDCHTTASWKELASPMQFNHSTTSFVLQGQHITVACMKCHTNGRFAGTSSACFDCHQSEYMTIQMPNHNLGKFSHDCAQCHTTNGWQQSIFEHSKTNFQLTGAHQSVDCASCHTNNRYAGLQSDCFSCHQQAYNQTVSPNHSSARFSHECLNCHTTSGWKPSSFDHAKTNFPLSGAHRNVDCSSCHVNGKFTGLPTDCFGCHQMVFAKVTTPGHVTGNFDHNCTLCHTVDAWKPSTFNHAATAFPLAGAHQAVACASCHKNGVFKGTASDCFSCHQQDFARPVNPNHITAQLSHDCTQCHTTAAWKPSSFDHQKTAFPLTGAHRTTDCSLCHTNGRFTGLQTDCYTCHQTDFSKVSSPNHVSGGFDHNCTVCHTTSVWKPSTFNHAATAFPLTGAHQTTDCASCHKNGVFKGTATDCYSCHQADFAKPVTPNHVTSQLSHDCTQCHSTAAWKPATFDHQKTNFPLTGAHLTTLCASCHVNGKYSGLPTDCFTCHQTDFARPTAPNHVTAQFSHYCTPCHTTIVWKPSTFNHATTAFPLTGAHQTTDCLFCHKNGQYKGTPVDCWTCHQTDFSKVTDPNHVTGGFDHICTLCHTTAAWKPATFDHNKTAFPLTGAHAQTVCAKCHVGGKYAGTATDCYTCHLSDFNAAKNPDHASAQYPHDCTQCHSTSVWQPWTFNHDSLFRINSNHRNRTSCSDCHRTAGNLKSFTCLSGCHARAHRQNEACYPCHTN